MTAAMHRTPCLETAQVKMLLNGPESFTPDGNFILGEAPELAQLLRRRRLQLRRHRQLGRRRAADRRMDRRRAARRATSRTSTSAASARSWPTASCCPSAPARRSACTTRCAGRARSSRRRGRCAPRRSTTCSPPAARCSARRTAGSAPTTSFAPTPASRRARPTAHPHTLDKPHWLADVIAEQRATREAVALYDQTSFGKLLLQGRDALARARSASAPTRSTSRPGAWSTRALLNERGGFESDLTITRLGVESFLVVTGSAQPTRDADWIGRHIGGRRSGDLGRRQRPDRGALGDGAERDGAALPRRRPDTAARLAPDRLKFSSTRRDRRRLRPGARRAHELRRRSRLRALRADRDGAPRLPRAAGEPAGRSRPRRRRLLRARRACGSRPAGAPGAPSSGPTRPRSKRARCSRSSSTSRPHSSAARPCCARRAQPPAKRLVSLVFESADAWAWGGEALLCDGEPAGEITSAGWSSKLGACVALGYLRGSAATERHEGTRVEVDVWGERVAATASGRSRPDAARGDVSEPAPFSLRSIAVPAFGPSLLFAIGEGAILPLIAARRPRPGRLGRAGGARGHADRHRLARLEPARVHPHHPLRRALGDRRRRRLVRRGDGDLCMVAAPGRLTVGVFMVGMAAAGVQPGAAELPHRGRALPLPGARPVDARRRDAHRPVHRPLPRRRGDPVRRPGGRLRRRRGGAGAVGAARGPHARPAGRAAGRGDRRRRRGGRRWRAAGADDPRRHRQPCAHPAHRRHRRAARQRGAAPRARPWSRSGPITSASTPPPPR